jgi:hypothetical protein
MPRTFEHVGALYEVSPQRRANDAPVRLDFQAARRLLAHPMGDSRLVRGFRELLAAGRADGGVSRMTDVEVLEALASRIAMRQLHVYTRQRVRRRFAIEVEVVDEVLEPLAQAPADEPAEEHVDVPAQVAVMLQAAHEGVPFCEECEKARLEEDAASATAPASVVAPAYAGVDVPAQAAVMREAAAAGSPFCEECEKARLEELDEEKATDAAAATDSDAPVAPRPDDFANTDVAAQAATMTDAATEGAPFCEECEKARLAEESSTAPEGD